MRVEITTVDHDAIETAQRMAIAGNLDGRGRKDLRIHRLTPAKVVERLEAVLRVLAIRVKRASRAAHAREKLPAMEKRLEEARADLSTNPDRLRQMESETRFVAKRAKADPKPPQPVVDRIEVVNGWVKAIRDDKDADALVEATEWLRAWDDDRAAAL